jgi:hypothetical protein
VTEHLRSRPALRRKRLPALALAAPTQVGVQMASRPRVFAVFCLDELAEIRLSVSANLHRRTALV